jgi:hypothetical protein
MYKGEPVEERSLETVARVGRLCPCIAFEFIQSNMWLLINVRAVYKYMVYKMDFIVVMRI